MHSGAAGAGTLTELLMREIAGLVLLGLLLFAVLLGLLAMRRRTLRVRDLRRGHGDYSKKDKPSRLFRWR